MVEKKLLNRIFHREVVISLILGVLILKKKPSKQQEIGTKIKALAKLRAHGGKSS